MEIDGFDWDQGNLSKCQNHGVTRFEIEALFLGEPHIGPTPGRSDVESRFRAIGKTREGRNLFVVFAWRGGGIKRLLRPISARYMHQKETLAYGEAISGFQDGRRS